MMIFRHTSRERGMWRGWLESGHVLEIHWGREPIGVVLSECDDDGTDFRRQLWIGLGLVQAFIPLWKIDVDDAWDRDEPAWGIRADREHAWFRWGAKSRLLDWPWMLHTLAYEMQMADGSWESVFKHEASPRTEDHPYSYTLKSGEVQKRTATVSKRRHVLTYAGTRWLRWPRWIRESIEVQFDGEVGERSGSWKGGTIGCGYTMLPGETPLQTLRRMEVERVFK